MSSETKSTISFISTTFVKVILSICGIVVTMFVADMRQDMVDIRQDMKIQSTEIKEVGDEISTMKERMATVEAFIKFELSSKDEK